MERSEGQWKGLLNSIGLEVQKVWQEDSAREAMTEA